MKYLKSYKIFESDQYDNSYLVARSDTYSLYKFTDIYQYIQTDIELSPDRPLIILGPLAEARKRYEDGIEISKQEAVFNLMRSGYGDLYLLLNRYTSYDIYDLYTFNTGVQKDSLGPYNSLLEKRIEGFSDIIDSLMFTNEEDEVIVRKFSDSIKQYKVLKNISDDQRSLQMIVDVLQDLFDDYGISVTHSPPSLGFTYICEISDSILFIDIPAKHRDDVYNKILSMKGKIEGLINKQVKIHRGPIISIMI